MRRLVGDALLAVAVLAPLGIVIVIGSDRIDELMADAGPQAPAVFVLAKAATFVVAPLSGSPLKVAAGALFGFWEGVAYSLAGDVLGGSANFWIARLFGRVWVRRLVGERRLQQIERLAEPLSTWRGLIVARVFLAPVYDFVSYAAGLTATSYRRYLIVSAVAGAIPTIALVGVGASTTVSWVVQLIALAALALGYAAVWFGRQHYRHSTLSQEADKERDDG